MSMVLSEREQHLLDSLDQEKLKIYNDIMEQLKPTFEAKQRRTKLRGKHRRSGLQTAMEIFVLNLLQIDSISISKILGIHVITVNRYMNTWVGKGYMTKYYEPILDIENFFTDLCMASLVWDGFMRVVPQNVVTQD